MESVELYGNHEMYVTSAHDFACRHCSLLLDGMVYASFDASRWDRVTCTKHIINPKPEPPAPTPVLGNTRRMRFAINRKSDQVPRNT